MAAMPVSFIRTDSWNADLYESASTAYRISSEVSQGIGHFRIYLGLVRLNRSLDGLFTVFLATIEGFQSRCPPPSVIEPMTKGELNFALNHLWSLKAALDRLGETSVQKILGKKALLANQLKGLQANRERLLDLIQWMEFSNDEVEMATAKEMFSSGLEELGRGETVSVE